MLFKTLEYHLVDNIPHRKVESPMVPWLIAFRQSPSVDLLDELLWNTASLDSLSAADSHSMLLMDWIKCGWCDSEVVDCVLQNWININWQRIPEDFPQMVWYPWVQAALLITECPLPVSAETAKHLMLGEPLFLDQIAGQGLRDSYRLMLYALACNQTDNSLQGLWHDTCRLLPRLSFFGRGRVGVYGIWKMPGSTVQDVADALILWKECLTTLPREQLGTREKRRNIFRFWRASVRYMCNHVPELKELVPL